MAEVRYQLWRRASNGSVELGFLLAEKLLAGLHDLAVVEDAALFPDDGLRPNERGILD
jgi:hypothetical protein